MVQLSFDIANVTDTDFDGNSITEKQVTPKFDGVVDGFQATFPTSTTDADCKTAIKDNMTAKGVTWDTEI